MGGTTLPPPRRQRQRLRRPPWGLLLPPLLLSLLLWAAVVEAYPTYLLDPKGCVEKKLEVGFVMMGNASVADRKRRSPIRVRGFGCGGVGVGVHRDGWVAGGVMRPSYPHGANMPSLSQSLCIYTHIQ